MTNCTDVSHSKCYCMRIKTYMILKVVQGNIQEEPFAAQQIPASFIHGVQYSIPHTKTWQVLKKDEKDVKIINASSYYGFARKRSEESVT